MEYIDKLISQYFEYASDFISSMANPDERVFFVYLAASLFAGFLVYKSQKTKQTFLTFLFPKHVWSNPSAWLDVRYFFFHGLIGHFLLNGVAAATFATSIYMGIGMESESILKAASPFSPGLSITIAVIFLLFIAVLTDLIAFAVHYYQHKIPILWQFHKVHHSGEVMHPLSNYREHPVDNLAYKIVISLFTGLAIGLSLRFLGYKPSPLEIFGLSAINIAFNMSAYHLRHSHIWLKWPGIWSKVFPSPAHHHVHHSRHPDHLDKNFAFFFPVWDVIFGTYCMPKDNTDVEFGTVEDSSELNSCLSLYFIPFRDAYRIFTLPKESQTKAEELANVK